MTTQPLDASGAALRALQTVVADYGAAALSDAQFMNNVLRDLLPDEPREASVLVAAAEANVGGIIGDRVAQHISPGAAIAQAAAVLGERTALTQDACQWAASLTARAMGLLQAPGMDATASVAADRLPPPMPPPPGVPPTAPGPGGYSPPSPPGPPRAPISKTGKLAAAGVGAVIVLYLVIAAAAHLAPFGKAKNPDPAAAPASSAAQTTPPSPSASPSASPSSSPTPSATTQLTAEQKRLFALIPSTVQSDGTCTVDKLEFGAIAQISCRDEKGIPPAGVTYYLFSTAGKTNSAYSYFRSKFAHTTEQAGHCNSFTEFVPCETSYSVGSSNKTEGRVVEYRYKSDPDMTFTATKYKVLIDAVADKGVGHGNALVKWWTKGTGHWLNGTL
jgi:hypothetical protein